MQFYNDLFLSIRSYAMKKYITITLINRIAVFQLFICWASLSFHNLSKSVSSKQLILK